MQKKKIRILPLGYALAMTMLLMIVVIAALITRNHSAPEKLFYSLNTDNELKTYTAYFSLTTIGDAVNYQNKSIDLKYKVTSDDDFIYIEAEPNAAIGYTPIQLYLMDQGLLYKNKTMNHYAELPLYAFNLFFDDVDLNLEELIEIIDWEDEAFQTIVRSNLLQMKTSFNSYTKFSKSSKNNVIVTFDIDALFEILEAVVADMMLHESFESEILSRVSKIYDLYGQNDIIKVFNLDSTIMFGNLVDWTTNFEATFYKRLAEYKTMITDTYSADSTFTIHFTLSKNQIEHITFNSELNYNNCDASEWIEWTYARLPIDTIESPVNYTTQNIEPYIDIIKTHFELNKK